MASYAGIFKHMHRMAPPVEVYPLVAAVCAAGVVAANIGYRHLRFNPAVQTADNMGVHQWEVSEQLASEGSEYKGKLSSRFGVLSSVASALHPAEATTFSKLGDRRE